MNGLALLMAAAVLGVDYGWQPTADGQLEYIIQIEPVTLVALRGGQELVSQVDPYVRNVRRFRIHVGTEMVPRRGMPPREPAAPRALPVPTGVQYGWQGIDSQQMEFIVQLSPERLAIMRNGEDVVGEIPADVQNVTRMRIRSGVEPVPRQGLQVASANLSVEEPAAETQVRENAPAVDAPTAARDPGQTHPDTGPPIESPARLDPERQALNNSQATSSPAGQPGRPPASDPYSNAVSDQESAALKSPGAEPPGPRGNASAVATDAGNRPSDGGWAGQNFPAWPPSNDGPSAAMGSGAAQPQPAGPASAASAQTGREPQASPPTVQVPYAPQWSSGQQSTVGQPSGWNQQPIDQPTAGAGWQGSYAAPIDPSGSGRSGYWPMSSGSAVYQGNAPYTIGTTAEIPLLPWERRLVGDDSASKSGEYGKDFWASLAEAAGDPSLAYLRDDAQADADDRPWGPLALALMVMFVSLGGNLYMGWIAVDMYRRYMDLADDLSDQDSTPRSSAADDSLDDDEDWSEFRRRRDRVTIAA